MKQFNTRSAFCYMTGLLACWLAHCQTKFRNHDHKLEEINFLIRQCQNPSNTYKMSL